MRRRRRRGRGHCLLPDDGELVEGELGHRLALKLVEELDDRARARLVHELLLLARRLCLRGTDARPSELGLELDWGTWLQVTGGAPAGGIATERAVCDLIG